MAQFHFVEDYEKLVTDLVNAYPMDEAMSRAVGGNYELVGRIEAELLSRVGLEEGMQLVDLGCGSGRLAFALHDTTHISYVGIDIVQALLDYAKTKAPGYQFILHRELSIPQPDNSADMVTAFSLFTHLLHTESYLYLEECVRILKPDGKVVFSFLEFAEQIHWEIFSHTCQATKLNTLPHLNTFIERGTIEVWASKLGLAVESYIAATDPVLESHVMGQAVVVLRKQLSSDSQFLQDLPGQTDGTGLPVPPTKLRERVHGDHSLDTFNRVGQAVLADVEAALGSTDLDVSAPLRVLDFGCGCGRIARWLHHSHPNWEYQGTDIDAEGIAWNQEYLSSIGRFHVNREMPPLVHPDGGFDFVFSISIFTHLPEDMHLAWLEELRRITRPGGWLLLTVHGEALFQNNFAAYPAAVKAFQNHGFYYHLGDKTEGLPDFYQTTFHTGSYINTVWSRYFRIVRVVEKGIGNHQDLVLCQRLT